MIYAPETQYKYSNLGMAILGEIVAAVSSLSYAEYVHQHLLEPLGLQNTKVFLTKDDRARLATGYLRFRSEHPREIAPFTDSRGLTPAANLSSTAIDLARFCIFHYDWKNTGYNSILKASTRQEMQRSNWLDSSWESARGLGFSVSKSDDGIRVGHGGWVAGYRSQILFDPQMKIAVVILINTEDFSPNSVAKTILKIWTSWEPETVSDRSTDRNISGLAGQYTDPSYWQTDVIQLGASLYFYDYGYPPDLDPSTSLRILVPETDSRFKLTGPRGNGEPVIFITEQTGKVSKIKIGANYIYPLSNY
jgi:CubicO group peptidase (beta-lactamase class C family)